MITIEKLAERQMAKAAVSREEVRANYPNACAFADLFKSMGAKLKFAEEGGKTIGKQLDGPRMVLFDETTPRIRAPMKTKRAA